MGRLTRQCNAAGSKCAHVIDGTNKDLSAKEFRSFGTLNALWASLIKITVGLPPAMGRALTQCKHASDGCGELTVTK